MFMNPVSVKLVDEFVDRALSGGFDHVVFLIGSAVSLGSPSCMPNVEEVRSKLVLGSLLNLNNPDSARGKLLGEALDDKEDPSKKQRGLPSPTRTPRLRLSRS